MPIRVNCHHCGKQFSAWDDLRGKSVECPKCKGKMTIPGNATPPATKKAGVKPKPKAKKPPSAPASPPVLASSDDAVQDLPSLDEMVDQLHSDSSPADDLPSLDYLLDDHPSENAAAPAVQPPTPPVARPTANPKTSQSNRGGGGNATAAKGKEAVDEFDASEDLPLVCDNCHAPLPSGEELCDACGYHRILQKVLDMDGVQRPTKSTGFERVLKQQLNDGETVENVLRWAKIVAGLGMLIVLAFIWLCMGPLASIVCLLAVVGLVAWLMFRYKQKQQSGTVAANDPISDLVWTGLLEIQRVGGWRLPEWPFPKTTVLTMHDPSFTDDDLGEFDDLQRFQTLDLESSQITDRGLAHLERMKQLRFLVVRRTQVTEEGVRRLQQKLGDAMIWR